MFDTLLESRARRRRHPALVAASAVAHAAVIAGAVWATAQADASVPREPESTVVWLPTPPEPAPRAQPAREAPPVASPDPVETPPSGPVIDVPIVVPDGIPDVDLSRPPIDPRDFEKGIVGILKPGGVTRPGSGGDRVAEPGGPMSASVVDREVVPRVDNPPPRYPDVLRSAGVEGGVSARFVVDTLGRVEPRSIELLEATHPLFSDAVRSALLRARYAPAEAGGRKVRQLVEQRFGFVLQ